MDGIIGIQRGAGTTTIEFPSDEFPDKRERKASDPHRTFLTTYARFYINEIGLDEALKKEPKFPAGTVITRAKLLKAEDTEPELVTAMVKREKGFSRKTGDWEYLVLSGDLKKVIRREKYGDCAACHAGAEKTDFVFNRFVK